MIDELVKIVPFRRLSSGVSVAVQVKTSVAMAATMPATLTAIVSNRAPLGGRLASIPVDDPMFT
jgi:hypothetical protein